MPNSICLTNGNGNHVNRLNKSIKIASPQWTLCVWVVFILSVTQNHVGALTELHIGGIFPIGGKGGWQGTNTIFTLHSPFPLLTLIMAGRNHIENTWNLSEYFWYLLRGASMSTSCWIGAWRREQQIGFASRFQAYAIQQWQRGKWI